MYVTVTVFPVPTPAVSKPALATTVTASPATTPPSAPALTCAVVVPSYSFDRPNTGPMPATLSVNRFTYPSSRFHVCPPSWLCAMCPIRHPPSNASPLAPAIGIRYCPSNANDATHQYVLFASSSTSPAAPNPSAPSEPLTPDPNTATIAPGLPPSSAWIDTPSPVASSPYADRSLTSDNLTASPPVRNEFACLSSISSPKNDMRSGPLSPTDARPSFDIVCSPPPTVSALGVTSAANEMEPSA